MSPLSQNTRRWPRHQVDLPVRIVTVNGVLTNPVPARASQISRAGMSLRASVSLKPGDRMQLRFPTSTPLRVTAVVRNRTGDRLGLEFLTQLPPDDEAGDRSSLLAGAVWSGWAELREPAADPCNPQSLYAGIRRKQEELRQVRREIEALHMAILLLADDENELSDSLGRIIGDRMQNQAYCGLDGGNNYAERPHWPTAGPGRAPSTCT